MEKTTRDYFFDYPAIRRTPDIAVRTCGIFTLVPPDRENIRHANFGEIFWPVSGRGLFHFQGKEAVIQPGMLWYYPPGSLHDFYPLEPFHYCWLSISGKYAKVFFQMFGITPGINPTGLCPENLFYALGREIDCHPKKIQRFEALNIAFRILTMSIIPQQSKPSKKILLEEIKKRIDTDFMNHQLSVNRLSEEYGIHRSSLSKLFHHTYGKCISEYLTSLRLQHAFQLLQESDAPIREIVFASGFNSVSYFDRMFTAAYGMPPSIFRSKKR